jgi:hypothetical protein
MAVAGYQIRINGGSPINVGNVLTTTLSALRGISPPPNESDDYEIRAFDNAVVPNFSAYSPLITVRVPSSLDGANIFCTGNSLTRGFGASAGQDYPSQLFDLLTEAGVVGHTVTNVGHDSQTSSQLNVEATFEIDPFLDPARRNIVICNEIGNDIYFNGDVASALVNFQALCEHWVGNPIPVEVVVLGLADRGLDPTIGPPVLTPFGDTRTQYRTKMSAAETLLEATVMGFTGVVAFSRLLSDPALANCLNLTYFYADQTHNHDAGYARYAVNGYNALVGIDYTDTLPPLISSITVENAHPNQVVFTYNERLNATSIPAPGDFAFSGGKTATAVSIALNVVTVTLDGSYDFTSTITASYTPGANKIKDLSGNLAASLSSHAVVNNINPVEIDLVFEDFTFMSQAGTTLTADFPVSIWNHFAKATYKLPASTDGYIKARYPQGNGTILGFKLTNVASSYSGIEYYAYQSGGVWYYGGNASPTPTGVDFVNNDYVKVRRVAGVISVYRERAGLDQLIHTFGTDNSELFINAVIALEHDTIEVPVGANIVPI